jgi:hypothetical protein
LHSLPQLLLRKAPTSDIAVLVCEEVGSLLKA